MPNEEAYYQMLIQAVQVVSANATTQMDVLPNWVHIPDEIVNIYNESYILVDQLIEAGLVSSYQVEALNNLHNHIHEMTLSRDTNLWTLEALKSHPKWDEMRVLAKNALKKLGVEIDRPNLGWVRYIPGGK